MSLLTERMELCHIMACNNIPDGEGGYTKTWYPVRSFAAAIGVDNKMAQVAGESAREATQYSVITDKANALPFHAVIKRADNSYLRVISSSADRTTPAFSASNAAWCTAEVVEL